MANTIQTKCCSRCKEIKSLSEFYKDKRHLDGHQSDCKVCFSKQIKKYHQTDKYKIAQKRYQQTERYKARIKRCNQSKAGKAKIKRYRQTKKGKKNHRKSAFLYRNLYPERVKAYNAVRHAIAASKLSSPKFLLCHYCPKPAQQYHHWHGYESEHWLDVVPVCKKCHNHLSQRRLFSIA